MDGLGECSVPRTDFGSQSRETVLASAITMLGAVFVTP